MTTGITTISQDSFSRIDALLARARETTEAKRTSRDAAGAQSSSAASSASVVQGVEAPVQTAEADQAYTAVMDMLSSPSGDVHNSLDPDRVARLLGL